VNTSAQVGGALVLAVLATLSTTRTGSLLAGGEWSAAALTGGYHMAFLIGAGLVVAAVAIAAAVLEPAPRAQARATADSEPAGARAALCEAG
jgi:hypothetical protein